jgi:hypothetical protein
LFRGRVRDVLLESPTLQHGGIKLFQFFVLNESTPQTTTTLRGAFHARFYLAEASL